MGLWDLIQQTQISDQEEKTQSLEQKVKRLERELKKTQKNLHELVCILEKHLGKDINKDGKIG